jgi:hypothetical protein
VENHSHLSGTAACTRTRKAARRQAREQRPVPLNECAIRILDSDTAALHLRSKSTSRARAPSSKHETVRGGRNASPAPIPTDGSSAESGRGEPPVRRVREGAPPWPRSLRSRSRGSSCVGAAPRASSPTALVTFVIASVSRRSASLPTVPKGVCATRKECALCFGSQTSLTRRRPLTGQ